MIKIRLCGLVKVQLPNLISKTSSSYFFLSVDDGNNVDIKTGYEKRNESVQSSSLKKSGKRCEFFDEEIFWGELVTALWLSFGHICSSVLRAWPRRSSLKGNPLAPMNSRSQTKIQENVHPKNSFNVGTLTSHNTNLEKNWKITISWVGVATVIQLITYKSKLTT